MIPQTFSIDLEGREPQNEKPSSSPSSSSNNTSSEEEFPGRETSPVLMETSFNSDNIPSPVIVPQQPLDARDKRPANEAIYSLDVNATQEQEWYWRRKWQRSSLFSRSQQNNSNTRDRKWLNTWKPSKHKHHTFFSFFGLERKILNFVLHPPLESQRDFQCIPIVLFLQVKDPVYSESTIFLLFSHFLFCIHLHRTSILCSVTEYLEPNNWFIQPWFVFSYNKRSVQVIILFISSLFYQCHYFHAIFLLFNEFISSVIYLCIEKLTCLFFSGKKSVSLFYSTFFRVSSLSFERNVSLKRTTKSRGNNPSK